MFFCTLGTAAGYFDKLEEVFSITHPFLGPTVLLILLIVPQWMLESITEWKPGLKQKIPHFILHSLCHFLLNAVYKLGTKDFEQVSGFDVEEIHVHVAVDVF